MTLSGIKPVTFWLVVQCLNQLRHCVPHNITGQIGNMGLINSGFHTQKDFSKKYPQFGQTLWRWRHLTFSKCPETGPPWYNAFTQEKQQDWLQNAVMFWGLHAADNSRLFFKVIYLNFVHKSSQNILEVYSILSHVLPHLLYLSL